MFRLFVALFLIFTFTSSLAGNLTSSCDPFSLESSIEFDHHECDSEDHDSDSDDCEEHLLKSSTHKSLKSNVQNSKDHFWALIHSHYIPPVLDGIRRPPRA